MEPWYISDKLNTEGKPLEENQVWKEIRPYAWTLSETKMGIPEDKLKEAAEMQAKFDSAVQSEDVAKATYNDANTAYRNAKVIFDEAERSLRAAENHRFAANANFNTAKDHRQEMKRAIFVPQEEEITVPLLTVVDIIRPIGTDSEVARNALEGRIGSDDWCKSAAVGMTLYERTDGDENGSSVWIWTNGTLGGPKNQFVKAEVLKVFFFSSENSEKEYDEANKWMYGEGEGELLAFDKDIKDIKLKALADHNTQLVYVRWTFTDENGKIAARTKTCMAQVYTSNGSVYE